MGCVLKQLQTAGQIAGLTIFLMKISTKFKENRNSQFGMNTKVGTTYSRRIIFYPKYNCKMKYRTAIRHDCGLLSLVAVMNLTCMQDGGGIISVTIYANFLTKAA